MFRFIARAFCGLIACAAGIAVIAMVLSNRERVTLTLEPLPYEVTMPIYLVITLGFIIGLGVGLLLYANYRFRASLKYRRLRRQVATQAKTA